MYTDFHQNDHRSSIVRPYVITGGRTHARVDLALETLVNTTEFGRTMLSAVSLEPERRRLLDLCSHQLLSVAEISVHLQIPLGTARVVVADMAHEHLITIHEPQATTGPQAAQLLERIVSGLRRL